MRVARQKHRRKVVLRPFGPVHSLCFFPGQVRHRRHARSVGVQQTTPPCARRGPGRGTPRQHLPPGWPSQRSGEPSHRDTRSGGCRRGGHFSAANLLLGHVERMKIAKHFATLCLYKFPRFGRIQSFRTTLMDGTFSDDTNQPFAWPRGRHIKIAKHVANLCLHKCLCLGPRESFLTTLIDWIFSDDTNKICIIQLGLGRWDTPGASPTVLWWEGLTVPKVGRAVAQGWTKWRL